MEIIREHNGSALLNSGFKFLCFIDKGSHNFKHDSLVIQAAVHIAF